MFSDDDSEYARSLVVCSLTQLQGSPFLASIIQRATRCTRDCLVILLSSPHFNEHKKWHDVQKFLTWVYVQSTATAQEKGNVLLDVDVLLRGSNSLDSYGLKESEFDVVHRFEDIPEPAISTDTAKLSILEQSNSGPTSVKSDPSFPVVALGGTFDHLHAGHKILLSMSAWIATEKVIIGVTDDALLVNKVHKHVLQSTEERIERVRAFLLLFKPGLELSIVPISDVYGPTSWDPNIQALVVSKETLSGAAAIDKLRKEKGMPRLETFVIEVISASEILDGDDLEHLKGAKMSSTSIRQWIAEKDKLE